jgi:hypothetical protein
MNVRLLEAQGHVIITNSEGKRKPYFKKKYGFG